MKTNNKLGHLGATLALVGALAFGGNALAQESIEDNKARLAKKVSRPTDNWPNSSMVSDFLSNNASASLSKILGQVVQGLGDSGGTQNTFTFPFSAEIVILRQRLDIAGTVAYNPDAQGDEAMFRLDARIGPIDLVPNVLKANGADLVIVAIPGSQMIFSAGLENAEVQVGNATLTTSLPLTVDGFDNSFALTGNATLGQLFPFLAKAPTLGNIALGSLTIAGQRFDAEFSLNGKSVGISNDDQNGPGWYKMAAQGLTMGDVVPNGDLVPFLSKVSLSSALFNSSSLSLGGVYGSTPIELTATPSSFSLIAPVALSEFLPQLAGLPFADKTQFTALSLDDEKAEITGSYSGKTITVIRKRGADTALSVTAKGLALGDLFPQAGDMGLGDYFAFDGFEIAKDHLRLDVEIDQKPAEIYVLRDAAGKPSTALFYFDKLAPATFIPDAADSGIASVGLDNAVLAVTRQAVSFAKADLPGGLANKAGLADGKTLEVKPGAVAVSGVFDISGEDKLVSLLKTISINESRFPLAGTLSGDTFSFIAGRARDGVNYVNNSSKISLLSALNIQVSMTPPSLPGVSEFLNPDGPVSLIVAGNGDRANPRVKLSGHFPVSLTIGGSTTGLLGEIDMDKGLAGKNNSFGTLTVALDKPWNEPFGVPDINVTQGSFVFDMTAGKDVEITLTGAADFAGLTGVTVTGDFGRKDGKLAFNYFSFDAAQGFPLSGLPGFSGVPHASAFKLDTVKLSPSGVEARTTIGSAHVDAFMFKNPSGGPVFGADVQGLKLADLLPGLDKTPMKDVVFANAALVVSESAISGDPATLPAVGQDLFKDIFGESSVGLKLPAGVSLVSEVDFSKLGTVGQALSKIGVHENSAVIMGTVGGLFGQGSPSLSLDIVMEQVGNPSGLPRKAMNYKPGAQPSFFITWAGDTFDIGVQIGVQVKAGKDLLEFDSRVMAAFSETGVGIELAGSMNGTWHQPFGIKPLTLSNVTLTTSIDALGNVGLGFAGSQTFGKESLKVATDMKFALEAEGLPDAVAFSGTADVIGPDMLLEIAQAVTEGKLELDRVKIPMFNLRNPNFAFATPGATDPQLGIVSEGVAFAGDFEFMEQSLGKVQGTAGTAGLKFAGKLKDFTWGPVSIQDNDIDIQLTTTPKLVLNGNIKIWNARDKIALDLTPPKLDFVILEDLGETFGKIELAVEVTGVDLAGGRFLNNADVLVAGEMTSSAPQWMEKMINTGIGDLHSSASSTLDEDKAALADAAKAVAVLDDKIKARRDQLDREKAQVEGRIQQAEDRVNSLQNELNNDKSEMDTCGNKLTHYFCKPYWALRYAGTWAAKEVADGVLEAAKVATNIAFDLDPEIVALQVERDTATLGLGIAKAVVDASEAVVDVLNNQVKGAVDEVLENLPLEIDRIFFAGDVQGLADGTSPFLLDASYKMLGTPHRDYVAFKLKDWKFNAASFAPLVSSAVDLVVDKVAGKISPDAATWLKNHIGTELVDDADQVSDEVSQAEAKFQKVLDTLVATANKYVQAAEDMRQLRQDKLAAMSQTDFLGPSEQFANIYVAVGHSSLCLAVASDGTTVHQENCKDVATERWSTKGLGDGYAQLLSNGLCLQAQPDSPDPKSQGVKLALKSCEDKDQSEQWKVSSYDQIYYQIINRQSQKCLHFDSESAKAGDAKAVWTSCNGVDSQSFRPIADAEAPNNREIKSALQTAEGNCVWYTYTSAGEGYQGLLNADNCEHPNPDFHPKLAVFNITELPDGGVRIVDDNSGRCLTATTTGGAGYPRFTEAWCTRANAMIFDLVEAGLYFMLKPRGDSYRGQCIDVGHGFDLNHHMFGPCDPASAPKSMLLHWIAPPKPAN